MADLWPITLGGITMDNEPDADGIRWRVLGFDGWDAQVVRADDTDRTGAHGGYGPRRLYKARPLTLLARAHCPDVATGFDVAERVHGFVPPSATTELVVHEPVAKRIDVDLGSGEVRASRPKGPLNRVTFQIPMVAFDPFKRATTATTVAVAAGATVSHTAGGTRPAVAEIEVTVTSPGTVDLTIAGLRLRWGSLPAGAVLTSGPGFTNPKRTARSSTGANLFGLIVQPMQWPAMVPGVNSIHQAGSANLSIRYFPTYA